MDQENGCVNKHAGKGAVLYDKWGSHKEVFRCLVVGKKKKKKKK